MIHCCNCRGGVLEEKLPLAVERRKKGPLRMARGIGKIKVKMGKGKRKSLIAVVGR